MQQVRVTKMIASFVSEDEDCDGTHKEVVLDQLDISPMESTALFQFLIHIRNLRTLTITRCKTKHFAFLELAKLLRDRDNGITALVIHHVSMTDRDAKYIIDALGSENCKVTKLDVGTDILTDESVRRLISVLKAGNCKLAKLDIRLDELTNERAKDFGGALRTDECKLTELNIKYNKLTKGAGYLLDAQNNVNNDKRLNITLTAAGSNENPHLSLSSRC
jgi:hypothetical protein